MKSQWAIDAAEIAAHLNDNVLCFADKRILISGARGFLGQQLVNFFAYLNSTQLEAAPVRLELLDNAQGGPQAGAGANVRQVDITKPVHPEDHVDYIFHMAGIASPYWYLRKPLETIDVNVWGTRNMLGIARAHGAKLLYPSTSELYQTAEKVPTPEDYVGAIPSMTDRSCYDVSKLTAETLCYVYAKNYGVHTSIVRIFNAFGPGLSQEDQRVLSKVATAVKHGTELTIYAGSPHAPARTYCYVANTIYGLLLAALNGKSCRPYNIGCDKPEITVEQLCKRVREVGINLTYRVVPPPGVYTTEPQRRCPDIARAQTELGFEPFVSLNGGLRRFLSWAMENYR